MRVLCMSNTRRFASRWGILLIKISKLMPMDEHYSCRILLCEPSLRGAHMRVFPMSNTHPFALSWGILLIKIPTSMQRASITHGKYSRVSPSLQSQASLYRPSLSCAPPPGGRNTWLGPSSKKRGRKLFSLWRSHGRDRLEVGGAPFHFSLSLLCCCHACLRSITAA